MRSASWPYMQCRVFSSYEGFNSMFLNHQMYSMILCSPSPGTSQPLRMTLSWRLSKSYVFKVWVIVNLVLHIELKLLVKLKHEFCAWRYCISIKQLNFFFKLHVFSLTPFFICSISSSSLLIHLCSRCYTINC